MSIQKGFYRIDIRQVKENAEENYFIEKSPLAKK